MKNRINETKLRKIINESIRRVLNENQILDKMILQVQPERFGEFWVRDTNSGMEFDVVIAVDNNALFDYDIIPSEKNWDKRSMQLCKSKDFQNMVGKTIVDEYPDKIHGFEEFMDMNEYDYNTAISILKKQFNDISVQTDTKYQKNSREAIRQSPNDYYSAAHGW